MAELTAATPGTSGGDRPVGHWGWENFFVLESVAATFVATFAFYQIRVLSDQIGAGWSQQEPSRVSLHGGPRFERQKIEKKGFF